MKASALRLGWLLFAIALALRATWILWRWTTDGADFSYDDELLHWQLADHLVHDGTLISDDGRYAARMPIYPLFLALFAWIGQAGVLLARLVQAILGAATAGLAYRLGAAAGGRRAGIAASLLICFDPFGVFFSNLLLTEVLFTLVAVGLVACAWRWLARSGGCRWSLTGLALLGPAAIMTRASAAAWIPLLWALLAALVPKRRRNVPRLLLCPIALIVLLLPWGLRNKATLGSYAWLSANGGVTLYDAQGPQADGSSDQSFLAELPELRGLDEVTLDRTLQQMAIDEMSRDPWNVLRLAGVKFLRTWSLTPHVEEHRTGAAAWACAIYTLAVLIAGLIGGAGSLFRRSMQRFRQYHALLWLPIICFTLLHCVYIGSVRYRVPLMPFLALAAATTVCRVETAPPPPGRGPST